MPLADQLTAVRTCSDLPSLVAALGYPARCDELPGPANDGALLVGQTDAGFLWCGLETAEPGAAARLARRLLARGRPAAVLALDPGARRLTVAVGAADARPLGLGLDAPDALALARLERCRAEGAESPLAAALRIGEALSGRGLDHRFFVAFRRTLAAVAASLPAPMPPAERHAFGLLQLTRVLFLYFVQAKGWLDGRGRFLRQEVDSCLARGRPLHRDLLRPLFFGTLNRRPADRSALARRFGAIPFLNGGLFEPHPLERRWRLDLPTATLRDAFDDLFEAFHFTPAPAGEDAIAPDMLGRVFEGVMEPDERRTTGTFYTPAALVAVLLRDAAAAWLAGRLAISQAEGERRLDDGDAAARRALEEVTVLDPAAGSGAFLLGALRLIAGPDPRGRPARLRRALAHSVYGVDRNPSAVRLAELRLWLEVIGADPVERPAEVTALPNLDALVRQGDSLVDAALAGGSRGLAERRPGRRETLWLASLRRQLLEATGPRKRSTLRALRLAELRLAREGVAAALGREEHRIEEVLEAARAPTLFGGRQGLTRGAGALLRELRAGAARLRAEIHRLNRADEVPWFDYTVQFGDVVARGGFDLVVGNPPWVRGEAIAPELRALLALRYRWFRPQRSGGYAHIPDLAVAFAERGVGLLAPGGVLAYLVPAKLATSGYAAPLRAGLVKETTLVAVADLRGAPAAFDATVYPLALVARRGAPPTGHLVRTVLGNDSARVPQQQLGPGAWVLAPEPVRRVLDRVRERDPSLGARFPCHLGVKSGCNAAFLDPPPEVERGLVRWALRGRDVRAFAVRRRHRLLWPQDDTGRTLPRLPPGAATHLGRHRGALMRRRDSQRGPWWGLFRTAAAARPHRVVWADLARRLEAAPLTGRRCRALIPLNTCYVAPVPDADTALRVAAWLNTTWCRAVARAITDVASGGFFRFNARAVGALPCPDSVMDDAVLLALGREAAQGRLDQVALDRRAALLLDLDATDREALAGLLGDASGDRR